MLLQLIPRMRRIALDPLVGARQLHYNQRRHRYRGSSERNARKSGEPPPCGKRWREYRDLEINGIPKCRRAEERREHDRATVKQRLSGVCYDERWNEEKPRNASDRLKRAWRTSQLRDSPRQKD